MSFGSRGRAHPLALLVASLFALSLLGPASSQAEPPLVVGLPSQTTVSEPADYATQVLNAPWDFDRADELNGPNTIQRGMLLFRASAKVQPTLLSSIASSQPWGRDGRISPVDTTSYPVMSLHLWSLTSEIAGISWTRCSWAVTSCRGYMPFRVQPGWHTYDLTVQGSALSSAPASWAGSVVGLRLTGEDGARVAVDYALLHSSTVPHITLPVTPAAGIPLLGRVSVFWDRDGSAKNNTADQPDWGFLTSGFAFGVRPSVDLPLGSLPAGTYRFYVVQGVTEDGTGAGPRSGYSAPVTIQAPPRPLVLTPNVTSGADYANTVAHNAWDMSQSSDYSLAHAKLLRASGGYVAAQNTSNDPQVALPIAKPFSGSTYHLVQIHVALLGTYGLANAPGQGCVGRLLWTTASGGLTRWQTTDDLVLYPGWNTVALDMATSPSNAIVDTANPFTRIGWAGQTITQVRFDPNEDPGKRTWYLDDVKISTTPSSSHGQFPISFQDATGAKSTTALIQAVDPKGHVAVVARGLKVHAGTNTVVWRPTRAVPATTYRIRVILTNSAGTTTRWASAPLQMIPA